jgi:hypothetical protein
VWGGKRVRQLWEKVGVSPEMKQRGITNRSRRTPQPVSRFVVGGRQCLRVGNQGVKGGAAELSRLDGSKPLRM